VSTKQTDSFQRRDTREISGKIPFDAMHQSPLRRANYGAINQSPLRKAPLFQDLRPPTNARNKIKFLEAINTTTFEC
jgi:hypothetical protein